MRSLPLVNIPCCGYYETSLLASLMGRTLRLVPIDSPNLDFSSLPPEPGIKSLANFPGTKVRPELSVEALGVVHLRLSRCLFGGSRVEGMESILEEAAGFLLR